MEKIVVYSLIGVVCMMYIAFALKIISSGTGDDRANKNKYDDNSYD